MFCPECGKQIENSAAFCPECGKALTSAQSAAPQPAQPVDYTYQPGQQSGYAQPEPEGSSGKVTFVEAIKLFFQNYANFTGRSTKSEYWWAFLFNLLVSMAVLVLPDVIGGIISIAFLIPSLSLGIRRLHDIGKPWPYILMNLIPIAGTIYIIVQYCKDSDGDNRWGPRR